MKGDGKAKGQKKFSTISFYYRSWEEKREFAATAKTVCNTCLTSVKSMCVSADISAFPVPNEYVQSYNAKRQSM